MSSKPTTIDAYLAALPAEQRAALEQVRQALHAAAPTAEEGMSYGLPVFRLEGKPLLWFGAAARHCALYGAVESACRDDLAGYDTSGKGTIRFTSDAPPPAPLIERLVQARIDRNAAR